MAAHAADAEARSALKRSPVPLVLPPRAAIGLTAEAFREVPASPASAWAQVP